MNLDISVNLDGSLVSVWRWILGVGVAVDPGCRCGGESRESGMAMDPGCRCGDGSRVWVWRWIPGVG